MKVLAYKTETTGLPLWKARSNDEGQPHLVRLSAILCDDKTGDETTLDVLIRPEGWAIPQETIDVHGVTNEKAIEEGISEDSAVQMFLSLFGEADQVVTSNKQFNNRIIRTAIKRYSTEEVVDIWASKPSFCATKMAKDDTGNKQIKLPEALNHYTGEPIVQNHDSLVDAGSAAKVFFAINNK